MPPLPLQFQMNLLCPPIAHSPRLSFQTVPGVTCWFSRTLNSFIPVEISSLLVWKGAICQLKKGGKMYPFRSHPGILPSSSPPQTSLMAERDTSFLNLSNPALCGSHISTDIGSPSSTKVLNLPQPHSSGLVCPLHWAGCKQSPELA